ncbi:hypothetical protein ACWGHD_19100 [Streptomyces xanthophaeus]
MSGALHVIESAGAPAIGDVRACGPDDCIYIRPDATTRKDWPKYWDAIGVALVRGAFVHIMNREGML